MRRCARSQGIGRPGSRLRVSGARRSPERGLHPRLRQVGSFDGRSELEIELKYFDGQPVIREISRVSKPGRGSMSQSANLPARQQTPGRLDPVDAEGVMADHYAREANVGGELLCTVF